MHDLVRVWVQEDHLGPQEWEALPDQGVPVSRDLLECTVHRWAQEWVRDLARTTTCRATPTKDRHHRDTNKDPGTDLDPTDLRVHRRGEAPVDLEAHHRRVHQGLDRVNIGHLELYVLSYIFVFF